METLTVNVDAVERKSVTTKHGISRHGRHISSEDIAAFMDKNVLPKKRKAIALHLAYCERCRKIVSEVVLSQAAVTDPSE
jgi:hypothetical protein